MRVLVVDDAKFMRNFLTSILTQLGHEVVGEADNGQAALAVYKSCSPDLVTMDITMPVMDGIQGLKLIKSYDANAKVIMCSAMGQQAMVVDAIKGGAKDFIVKPFTKERVAEALNKLS